MIKIHNFARGARGQRLMWQCEEMGLPYAVENHPFPGGRRPIARSTPLGTVPFLEDTGGVAINELVAMMLYVAHEYGPTPLLPTGDDCADGTRAAADLVWGDRARGEASIPSWRRILGLHEKDKAELVGPWAGAT